ncbi:MAG: anthranilate phosphoribosyltransferase [Candidatus Omnitrophica bacterium CG11_big_fil_rev_8_21_14_0_20_64_10]|nr:MAG: anthranilate phosphoribosyltransferase [Candidatus Omnitrophica bacterium CG11_big_fil_rev_8_21_14_0_20_64_10]
MLEKLTDAIRGGRTLTEREAEGAIGGIMLGGAAPEAVGAFLLALREKGEGLSEVVGAARAMRRAARAFSTGGIAAVDTCGTGGDGLRTANLSTLAAIVTAAAGAPVVKHGNRAITSACGSADLLEGLGIRVDPPPAVMERVFRETGFAFLFAPAFHPAMKAVAPIRKQLGVPTIFNLLGPLTNPAGVRHQVVGVADAGKMDLYAEALKRLGAERFLVVRGADGQDELSVTGPTEMLEYNRGRDPEKIARITLTPEPFGIVPVGLAAIQGGDKAKNVELARAVLEGAPGPVREGVVLNAAAALYVAGVAGDIAAGVSLAREALDRRKGLELVERLARLTEGEPKGKKP